MVSLACRARKCKHILVFRTIIFKSNFVTSQEQTKPTKVWKESSTREFDVRQEPRKIHYKIFLSPSPLDSRFFFSIPAVSIPVFYVCFFGVSLPPLYHTRPDTSHLGKRILVQRVACGFMGSDILSSSQEVPTDTNVGWNIYFHNS